MPGWIRLSNEVVGNPAVFQTLLDLQQVRFVARCEGDGVGGRREGARATFSGGVDALRNRHAEREVRAENDVVAKGFRLAASSWTVS